MRRLASAMSGAAGLGLVGTKKRSCDSETTCRSAGPKMTAPTLPPPTTRPCSHMGASVSVSNTVVLTSRSPCVLLADVHAPRRGACTSARRTHGEREVSTTVFDTETEAPMWEHGLVVGGGSVGAVIFGPADRQVVSLSHERFFVPTNPSPAAPDIAPASRLMAQAAHASGYADGLVWTDPLGICATLVITSSGGTVQARRTVDLFHGEVSVRWRDRSGGSNALRMLIPRGEQTVWIGLESELGMQTVLELGLDGSADTALDTGVPDASTAVRAALTGGSHGRG